LFAKKQADARSGLEVSAGQVSPVPRRDEPSRAGHTLPQPLGPTSMCSVPRGTFRFTRRSTCRAASPFPRLAHTACTAIATSPPPRTTMPALRRVTGATRALASTLVCIQSAPTCVGACCKTTICGTVRWAVQCEPRRPRRLEGGALGGGEGRCGVHDTAVQPVQRGGWSHTALWYCCLLVLGRLLYLLLLGTRGLGRGWRRRGGGGGSSGGS
jgi:hypothetical protein